MYIYKRILLCTIAQFWSRHNFMEVVIVLHKLSQGLLQNIGAIFEIRKRAQYFFVQLVQGCFPFTIKGHYYGTGLWLQRLQLCFLTFNFQCWDYICVSSFLVDEDWWIKYNKTGLVTEDNILQKNKTKNLLHNIQVLCVFLLHRQNSKNRHGKINFNYKIHALFWKHIIYLRKILMSIRFTKLFLFEFIHFLTP